MNKEIILTSQEVASLTVEKAINSGAHILLLQKDNPQQLFQALHSALMELISFVPNNLSGAQVVMYCESIIQDFPYWKPDDIILCMRNGKQGKYGKMFHTFTYQTLNQWFDEYNQERENHFLNQYKSKKEFSLDSERTSPKADNDFKMAKLNHLINQKTK